METSCVLILAPDGQRGVDEGHLKAVLKWAKANTPLGSTHDDVIIPFKGPKMSQLANILSMSLASDARVCENHFKVLLNERNQMKIGITSAILAVVASAALADGPQTSTVEMTVVPPVVVPFNWAGAYAGVQLGGIDSGMDLSGTNLNNNNTMFSALDPAGGTLGLFGGYNWQNSPNTVFGVEAEYNASNADAVSAGVPPPSFGFMRNRIESEISATAALRGRIGYASGSSLFYGTAGLALAQVAVDGYSNGGGNPFSYSDTLVGWTVGLGVERALASGWTARVDYRYSDYGNEAIPFTSGGGTPHMFNLNLQTHELRVGLARRF